MSTSNIHPTSVISKEVELGSNVKIGPFCIVKGRVRIGDNCILESHVSLGSEFGVVELGQNNHLFAGAVVGGPPQDLKYKGEVVRLAIGNNNTIRELATINLGTPGGGGITTIGSHCLIMSYAHVAHDCHIGDHVVIANSSQLAGHVTVEDHAKINGMCGFSQFIKIGKHAFIAGDSAVNKDIPPFTIAQGKYAVVRASNRIGLERAGYTKEEIEGINRAVRIITKGSDTIDAALERIRTECPSTPTLEYFLNFIKNSERGIAI